MTDSEKCRLIETPVTLNGFDAVISGRQMPVAMVRTLGNAPVFLSGFFAWHTVQACVAAGGNFRI